MFSRSASMWNLRYRRVDQVLLMRWMKSGRRAKTGSHLREPVKGLTMSQVTLASRRPSESMVVWVWTPVSPCGRLRWARRMREMGFGAEERVEVAKDWEAMAVIL